MSNTANTKQYTDDEIVVIVDNVSKRYVRNEFRPSLRHEAGSFIKRRLGLSAGLPWQSEPFWALKDVTFSVKRGEGVAVVGRNGAGKTTLLRILTGISRPTTGRAEVRGRFVTLMSLGTGFDNERSGRENIYLNAAIHGFHPDDVKDSIETIIDFSELGDFIDRPIKYYSAGMRARLGFSIAIFTFPDIILVDEVLAAGDTAFKQKCIAKIDELRDNQEQTIIFVSHSDEQIKQMCERSILLHRGELLCDGPTDDVLAEYHHLLKSDQAGRRTVR
ncbi:MAG: ABC transporter ATP-binding protein [Chloroflexi bacterium]|nr:MAG: ABC transporter ATP-binding protein [Chloroflexota bacterium]